SDSRSSCRSRARPSCPRGGHRRRNVGRDDEQPPPLLAATPARRHLVTEGSAAGGPDAPDPWWAPQGETGTQPYVPPPAQQATPDASLGSPHRGPHYVPA